MQASNSIRLKNTIYFPTIISFFLFQCIVPLHILESPTYTMVKYISLFMAMMYIAINAEKLLRHALIFAPVIGVGSGIILSTAINFDNQYNSRESIYYAILVFVFFSFLHILSQKSKLDCFYSAGRLYLILILAINDVLAILLPDIFYNVNGTQSIGTFIIGNKFNVAYAHLLLAVLCVMHRGKTIVKRDIALLVATAIVALCVQCTTVFIACLILAIMYFLPHYFRVILSNPIVVIAFFFFFAFVLLMFSRLLYWEPIYNLITEILKKDITLTGRMDIYPRLYIIFLESPWIGYGHANTEVMDRTIWYANAQNGFLDFTINYGIITDIFLVLLIGVVVSQAYKAKGYFSNILWLVLTMIYAYNFMGIVEICFSTYFFLYLSMFHAESLKKIEEDRKYGERIAHQSRLFKVKIRK